MKISFPRWENLSEAYFRFYQRRILSRRYHSPSRSRRFSSNKFHSSGTEWWSGNSRSDFRNSRRWSCAGDRVRSQGTQRFPAGTETIPTQGSRALIIRQTCRGYFSVVWFQNVFFSSAEACLFPHAAAFCGSGEVRQISLSVTIIFDRNCATV